ncbi:MAG: class I SAM-dependent methyltransferase, partial [Bacteroidales bacterium]
RMLSIKEITEYLYWKIQYIFDPDLSNYHYEYFYTRFWGLNSEFYINKNILDIGCGPRGSLYWAKQASKCVGLDPLAHFYRKMKPQSSNMQLIQGYSEQIPFPDNTFDIVSSFNSLDHVQSPEKTCSEIYRVLKPQTYFLLITEINHPPTLTEPHNIKPDYILSLLGKFDIIKLNYYKKIYTRRIYKSLREEKTLQNPQENGIMIGMFYKKI